MVETPVHVSRRGRSLAAAFGLVAATLLGFNGASAHAALIQVSVTGVAEAKGHVHVDLCTKSTFLTSSCPYQSDAPAVVGATLVTFAEVPPGEYAIQAFHDVTDQGVVHQNFLGIPKEKIGFSNDAPLHVRGPRFSDAAFQVGDQVRVITVKLRKLFGHHD